MISTNFNDPAFLSPPIINLDGFKCLLKLVLLKILRKYYIFELYLTNFSVNPIGIVDLITMVDFVFDFIDFWTASSTLEVSKESFNSS